jgi:CheY-like chemotaxis protein
MTANAYKEDIDKALVSGMNGHLAKPIDIAEVMKALSHWLVNRPV